MIAGTMMEMVGQIVCKFVRTKGIMKIRAAKDDGGAPRRASRIVDVYTTGLYGIGNFPNNIILHRLYEDTILPDHTMTKGRYN